MESLVNQIQGMLESATAMPFLYGFLAMFLTKMVQDFTPDYHLW